MSTAPLGIQAEKDQPIPVTRHPLVQLDGLANSNPNAKPDPSSTYPAYIDPYWDHEDPPERYPLEYPGVRRSWTFYPALGLVGVLGGSIPASL